MTEDILLMDGVRYRLWNYDKKERKNFEPIVVGHIGDIFGKDCLYFDIKKKIESITGERSLPDGYLIDLDKDEFYIIEVELSTHHEYDHINKQIGRFIKALKNYKTRQKIASALKDEVESDIVKKKFVIDKLGKEDIYQYFLEKILEKVQDQNFQILVIIDERTDKIKEACDILNPKPKIVEFKTFRRENAPSVHVHLFKPLYGLKSTVETPKSVELKDQELHKKIKADLQSKNKSCQYLKILIKCILKNDNRPTKREEIKKALVNRGYSKDEGQGGRHLSNVSQLITTHRPYWKEIIRYDSIGNTKENYQINTRYLNLIKKITEEISL